MFVSRLVHKKHDPRGTTCSLGGEENMATTVMSYIGIHNSFIIIIYFEIVITIIYYN